MSTQLVLGVAGAAVGSLFGSPQVGWIIGATLGGLLDQPQGPGPGDLSAPKLTQGSSIPRVYGRVRVPFNPVWVSAFRATEHSASGGKGAPSGGSSYTYSLDCLGVLADRSNVKAITRVWVNKELVYSALADSADSTLIASATTDHWEAIEFFPGTGAQVPWGVYETAVTTANASAYRNMATLGITGLQCGTSKNPPLIEVEVITEGTGELVASGPGGLIGTNQSTGYVPSSIPGTQVGDSLLLFIYHDGTSSTPAFASGWGTFIMNTNDSGGTMRVSVFGRIATGTSDDDAMTFTIGGGGTGLPIWGLACLRGAVDPRFPAAMANTADYASGLEGGGGYLNPNGITKTTSGDQFFVACGVQLTTTNATNITAPPTGYAFFGGSPSHTSYYSSDYGTMGLAYKLSSSVSENPDAFGITTGGNAAVIEVGITYSAAGAASGITPGTIDLKTIVDAELAATQSFDSADADTTALAGIPVIGFTASGPAAQTISQLGDIFYFETVPGNPIRFQLRGGSAVGTVAYADTGAAVGQPGAGFSGVKRENNDEIAAVRGVQYPNLSQNHEPGYETSDRLTTDGPFVKKSQTTVVMTPTQAKGRAITFALDARAGAHTASFGLSDKYAALEPGDPWTASDSTAVAYRLRAARLAYADGVRNIDWILDDTTALIETGATDETYTPSIVVGLPVATTLIALDAPILRDADNDPGAYSAVEGNQTSGTYPGATVFRSTDNVTFGEIASSHVTESTIGTTTTTLGDWAGEYVWDESSSVTVDVGATQTLSSSTADAMQADRTINVAFIGAHGRWEVIRFRTATLVSTGVYRLSGLLRGMRGSESHMDSHTNADTFVLANTSALRRMTGNVVDIGLTRYLKAVTAGRLLTSATSQTFTNTAVGLRPFSCNALSVARDTSNGDITFHWKRRTRLQPRYGGVGGSYVPLGEATEAYRVDVFDGSDMATVVRSIEVSSEQAPYIAADQIADFGSLAVYPGPYWSVVQLSSLIGDSAPATPPPPPLPDDFTGSYDGPITISAGGTYTGNWASTDDSPAVTITTTSPVILDGCRIKGPCSPVLISVPSGADMTLTNCVAKVYPSITAGVEHGVLLQANSCVSLIVEHCTLNGATIFAVGNASSSTVVRARYNICNNIESRNSNGAGGYQAAIYPRQFLQLNNVRGTSYVEIAWNQVINQPDLSRSEDCINLYESSGTSGGHILIHDNYIRGAYPVPALTNTDFSGGGIITDGVNAAVPCQYVDVYDNQILNMGLYGLSMANGNNLTYYGNTVVSSTTLTDGGPRIASANVGMVMRDYYAMGSGVFFNNVMHDNVIKWGNASGTPNPSWYPDVGNPGCSVYGNTESGECSWATQEAEYAIWLAKVSGAGHTLGSTLTL